MRPALLALAPILPALVACAQPSHRTPRVGDTYEIATDRESSEQSNYGSSGSSSDRDRVTARVIALRDGGVELEYDFPKDTTPDERASTWQLPVRTFRPAQGPIQLLNRAELEARVDPWLKKGGMTRAACGHWIFTWNAFRIECDPDSAIRIIEYYDPVEPELRDGAPYTDPASSAPAPLKKSADGKTFVVQLAIDPERVRRERAETDLSVAEISRKTLTPEEARRAHTNEAISGTIMITFELDPNEEVRRRIKVTTVKIATPDGRSDTRTITETMVRRLMPR
jgi:hypothetical protein